MNALTGLLIQLDGSMRVPFATSPDPTATRGPTACGKARAPRQVGFRLGDGARHLASRS